MKRLLYLETQPYLRAKEVAGQNQHEVLTPTRGVARSLRQRKQSLRDFATRLLQAQGIIIAPPLNAQRALREAIQQKVQPHDIAGMTRAWMPTVQALLQAAPNLEITLAGYSERAKQLIQVTQLYQHLLHQQNFVDSAEVLWRATEHSPERSPVLIYGYFQPQADELALIEAIAADNSIFCLPLADHALFTHQQRVVDDLQKQGWQVETTPTLAPETPGAWLANQFLNPTATATPDPFEIAAYAYPNSEAEARNVLTQVKQRLHEGVPAREIVVVTQDEAAYGPLLLDIAWEYSVPLRALYSVPLSATRIGAWLTLLLDVVQQQFPFELTARLLSHPLSMNAGAEFWATVRQQRPSGFDSWQKIAQTLEFDLSSLKLPSSARRDTWVEKLKGIFQAFNLRRRASRWARESVAYNALEDGLVTLSRPEGEKLTWPEFAEEVLASLAVLSTPAQPGRGGVELHTPLSVMGARYRHVFVMGALEGELPAPVQNDPMLDFYERKQLKTLGVHLPDAAEFARQAAFEFYALLHTATESFTISYAKVSGEPSVYFKRLGLSFSAIPAKAIASPEEARRIYLRQAESLDDPVLQQAIAAFQVEQHRESSALPNEYDGVVGVPFDYSQHWFSASQVTQLGQCPFKWFASRVLKLAEAEELDEELNPALRGNLYHKVVELALKAAQADPSLDVTDEQRLNDWFIEAEALVKLPSFTAWEARRVEHVKILRRAMQQPEFWPPGTEVLKLEEKFEGEWQGLKIRGYVDRLDRTEDGLVLIDYKTSSKAPVGVKDETGKARIDLQLPLYQAVAALALYPDKAVCRTSYFSLTVGKDISPKKTPTQAELEGVAERLKTTLSTGQYPVQPDIDGHACRYCAYDSLCRAGNRLNRKGETA
ncbi:MAG TPA: PD-(D/E)XK nuclease family protein [Leptolyngbyaceae cyanobacterium M33_DOE_097]|uniref:PD-(D/E)XK nuclease family protein n=1 Tax=Oscillatoriales cyanobacterium SpSt-418 TaxID=2282169 RepID=A0A7C3KJ36_9CYAN|nr:PD-(D/E)XK nuclease family protein [Leptolyngbyaceae cyanobacterium M33_DOE_097]